jgi:hypothetical protein
VFFIEDSAQTISDAQGNLLAILKAVAAAHPEGSANVGSRVLMRLLGLQRLEAFQFRLDKLVQKGHLVPRDHYQRALDRLVAV